MKATAEKVETNRVELKIELEPEKLSQAMDQAYLRQVRKAKIPGFRPGKASRQVFENYYGKQSLYEEALEKIIPDVYLEAVKDTGVEPVAQPEVDVVQLEEGQPFIFTAKVDVKPEVSLGEYFGLKATKTVTAVKPEDINAELENLRQKHAQLVPVEEGTIENGDMVTIDYEGWIDDKPFEGGTGTGQNVEVGKGFALPGLDEKLVGMRSGENLKTVIQIPEDYPQKEVAGQEASIEVKINAVRRKELAELDDEFAKDVSEHDTLEALRKEIEGKLKDASEQEADNAVREQVVKQVVENAQMEIPDSMVATRLDSMVEEVLEPVVQQGISKEEFFRITQRTEESLREELAARATEEIKQQLVLDAVAEKEKVEVTEEELTNELERMAKYYRVELDKLRELIADTGDLETLQKAIRRDKTVKLLVEKAEIAESTEEKPASDSKAE